MVIFELKPTIVYNLKKGDLKVTASPSLLLRLIVALGGAWPPEIIWYGIQVKGSQRRIEYKELESNVGVSCHYPFLSNLALGNS